MNLPGNCDACDDLRAEGSDELCEVCRRREAKAEREYWAEEKRAEIKDERNFRRRLFGD